MGSRRAAFMAGQRPKNRPTLVATTKPATTDQSGTVEGKLGTKARMRKLSRQPTVIPITPPEPVSTTASSRNCQAMSRRRAPIALRTPISRVRSVTETSMMSITPMPPTSRPIEEITTITSATVLIIWRNSSIRDSAVAMPKLSGSLGLT